MDKQHDTKNMNLDATSKQIAELKAAIFTAQENNEAKIQFIKEEIAAGRHHINSANVAAKLLEYAYEKQELTEDIAEAV